MSTHAPLPHQTSWLIALGAVAVVGSWVFACIAPLVALGIVAALTLRPGMALATVLAAWAANQAIGYGLLGYPVDGYSLSWGAALGVAPLAVTFAATRLVGAQAEQLPLVRAFLAFAAGLTVYELLLYGFALVAGGTEAFSPAVVAQVVRVEAAWFAALVALRYALGVAAPSTFGRAPRLSLA